MSSATTEVRTVLIVDDEERLRKALGRSLCQENSQTLTAASGEEALDLLEKRRIDLVITDLIMPGMDGMALVRSIKSRVPSMKIIILTAYGTAESMREAEELGVAWHLAKPFDLAQLKAKVNELLQGGETSESSRDGSSCPNECQDVHGFWAAIGKTLGSAAAFSRQALQHIKPINVVFALGKVTGAVSGLASRFRKSEVKEK